MQKSKRNLFTFVRASTKPHSQPQNADSTFCGNSDFVICLIVSSSALFSDRAVSVEMAQVSKVPVSRLIKQGEDEDGPTKKSRDEYRKAKELEEARYESTV